MDKRNFFDAAANAQEKRAALPKSTLAVEINPDEQTVPKPMFDRFFELQVANEKNGPFNYHAYARDLWREFVNSDEVSFESPLFTQFEANLIQGLHAIQMKDLVYQDIGENMPEMIQGLYPKVAKVILWSTGDVAATGYQDAKIVSSNIVGRFMRTARQAAPENWKDAIKNKTEYLVEDNKNAALEKYLATKKPPFKIAVIEDSRKNIENVRSIVKKLFGETDQVIVLPIWATYSREGLKERGKDDYEKLKQEYNGIDSFSEIARPPLSDQLTGAEVLVDFDGVIGDNMRMRNAQAQVKFAAIEQARAGL